MTVVIFKALSLASGLAFIAAVLISASFPTAGINYTGISAVIGAVSAFLTIGGTFVMQLLTFMRQGQQLKITRELTSVAVKTAAQTTETHELVNSQSEELKTALKTIARNEGIAEGKAEVVKNG